MKQLTAILFLLLYLNSFTEVHELLRAPLLFEHFAEHREQVSDISFWEFLAMHYQADSDHDAQDSKLPFKDPGHSFTVPAMALPHQRIFLVENPIKVVVIHASGYVETRVSFPRADFFQPPRIS